MALVKQNVALWLMTTNAESEITLASNVNASVWLISSL
jgi:hypothetical protein